MSWSTFFGAYMMAADAADGCGRASGGIEALRGSSRSGCFEQAVGRLLDAMPGHERLRCLSAQSCSELVRDADSVTRYTRIDAADAPALVEAIDALVDRCTREPERLAALWADLDLGSADEIARAIASARPGLDANDTASTGDEGDSAAFVFTVLASLREAAHRRVDGATVLVYWAWSP